MCFIGPTDILREKCAPEQECVPGNPSEKHLQVASLDLLRRVSTTKWHHGIKSTIILAVLAFVCASPTLGQGQPQSPTPPGLYITPTALPNAVQQQLNPGLALPYFATNYPNFVAGEAVKAVVSQYPPRLRRKPILR